MVANKEGLMSLIPSFFYAFKQTKAHAFFLLFNSRKGGEHWQPRTRVRTDERAADGNLIPSNLLPPQPPSPPLFPIPLLLRPAEADNLPPTSPSLPSTKARQVWDLKRGQWRQRDHVDEHCNVKEKGERRKGIQARGIKWKQKSRKGRRGWMLINFSADQETSDEISGRTGEWKRT